MFVIVVGLMFLAGNPIAIAAADLDGDCDDDLVIVTDGAAPTVWIRDGQGFKDGGTIGGSIAAAVALGDVDRDYDPDLAVSVKGAAMRLYIDRDGHLEDQSFVRLPQPAPIANAVAFGGWDDGCEPDAVIAADAGAATLHGQPTGAFSAA